jgi:hypothetical protein
MNDMDEMAAGKLAAGRTAGLLIANNPVNPVSACGHSDKKCVAAHRPP